MCKQVLRNASVCPACGKAQRGGKSKTVAALLAIFLGGFGAHRFYLGRWWGVLYLLFCWTMIPGLIALVEGIVFVFSNQATWDAKYNDGAPSSESGAGTVVVILVAVLGLVVLTGILAAIALPAYQDYTMRAKVAQALSDARGVSASVGDAMHATRKVPATLKDAGYAGPLPPSIGNVEIDPRGGDMTVTLRSTSQMLDGKTFVLRPTVDAASGAVTWQCDGGTLTPRHLPVSCRGQR